MALTPAEKQRAYRERKTGNVTGNTESNGNKARNVTKGNGNALRELERRLVVVEALLKAMDRRLCAVEDGPRAVRAAGEKLSDSHGGTRAPQYVPVERPGLGDLLTPAERKRRQDLQARIDAVVTRADRPASVTPTVDPRALTGQALRDYVRRYGPIATDDPGDAA